MRLAREDLARALLPASTRAAQGEQRRAAASSEGVPTPLPLPASAAATVQRERAGARHLANLCLVQSSTVPTRW